MSPQVVHADQQQWLAKFSLVERQQWHMPSTWGWMLDIKVHFHSVVEGYVVAAS